MTKTKSWMVVIGVMVLALAVGVLLEARTILGSGWE